MLGNVLRNVQLQGRRTSLRLESSLWEAIEEICRRERLSVHEFCQLARSRARGGSLTASVRVFVLDYFRSAATENGHSRVGHGRIGLDRKLIGAIPTPDRTVHDRSGRHVAA